MTDAAYLLDSNICIYLLGGESPAARERLERHEPGEVVVSAITRAEVMIGARRLDGLDRAEALFQQVHVRDFDAAAAACYAKLPFKPHRFDRLIAAHALSLGLVLVTNNEHDFADVPELRVENWTKA